MLMPERFLTQPLQDDLIGDGDHVHQEDHEEAIKGNGLERA